MLNCIGRGGFGPVYKVEHWIGFMPTVCHMLLLLLQKFCFGRVMVDETASMERVTMVLLRLGRPERWQTSCN
jgi:hypothetical protein